jgi:hypothetical protein
VNTGSGTSNGRTGTGTGAISVGGTGQINLEVTTVSPGEKGTDTSYPGTIYFSFSPTVSMLLGAPLKTAVFNGAPTSNWIWGGDFKAGYSQQGTKPISFGITGTFSAKGITTSDKGFALSISKLFGGSN